MSHVIEHQLDYAPQRDYHWYCVWHRRNAHRNSSCHSTYGQDSMRRQEFIITLGIDKQETRLSLTNRATRLEDSQSQQTRYHSIW